MSAKDVLVQLRRFNMRKPNMPVARKELKRQEEAESAERAKEAAVAAMKAGAGSVPRKELKDNSAVSVAPDPVVAAVKEDEEEKERLLLRSGKRIRMRLAREEAERAAREREQQEAMRRSIRASELAKKIERPVVNGIGHSL